MEDSSAAQCVFIEKGYGRASAIPPAPIPNNSNSTRAQSKKNRVFVLREFLLERYPCQMAEGCSVLDVAGGRGDLSFILRNFGGINSIIADPRTPNFKRLFKSVQFLLNYPEECKLRAEENQPTHQPLAKLLVELQQSTNDAKIDTPSYMRIHVDETLVEMLRSVIGREESHLERWDEYWNGRRDSIEANRVHYGGTAPRDASSRSERGGSQIRDSRRALEALLGLDFVCGFHPDQATEAAVDLALLLKKPFAVVPCCVFPSEFPERSLDGERVKTHAQLVEYLLRKHEKIKTATLPFVETDTAKNVVVYLLAEDA